MFVPCDDNKESDHRSKEVVVVYSAQRRVARGDVDDFVVFDLQMQTEEYRTIQQ